MEQFTRVFLWFMLYSFAGWFYETTLTLISEHRYAKKGCFNGPLCPIYGTGAVLMELLLRNYADPLLIFLGGGFTACALEYLTSWLIEKYFHVRLWDYSKRKFNLHGRCCLLGFVVFGLFAAVLVKLVHPYVELCLNLLPSTVVYIFAALLAVDLILDASLTIRSIALLQPKIEEINALLEQRHEEMEEKLRSLHRRNADFLQRLNAQQQNILREFPDLKVHRHNDVLGELRKKLREGREIKK